MHSCTTSLVSQQKRRSSESAGVGPVIQWYRCDGLPCGNTRMRFSRSPREHHCDSNGFSAARQCGCLVAIGGWCRQEYARLKDRHTPIWKAPATAESQIKSRSLMGRYIWFLPWRNRKMEPRRYVQEDVKRLEVMPAQPCGCGGNIGHFFVRLQPLKFWAELLRCAPPFTQPEPMTRKEWYSCFWRGC